MSTVIFYHKADLDGVCAAAIARMWSFSIESGQVWMHGVDYGDEPAWNMFDEDDTVWVVDFCFPKESMLRLLAEAGSVIWCDHHQTAIEMMGADGGRFAGIRRVGTAGCELAWEAALSDFKRVHAADADHWHPVLMPEVVRLLGRYDVWDHEDPLVMPFQYGMRAKPWAMDPESMWWHGIISDPVFGKDFIDDVVPKGQAILDYLKVSRSQAAEGVAYPETIDGHRFLVGNTSVEVLRARLEDPKVRNLYEDIEGVMGWSYRPGKGWVVSLRAVKDLDVGAIAKARGGGGHRGAAGFTIPKAERTQAGDSMTERFLKGMA